MKKWIELGSMGQGDNKIIFLQGEKGGNDFGIRLEQSGEIIEDGSENWEKTEWRAQYSLHGADKYSVQFFEKSTLLADFDVKGPKSA